MFLLQNMMTAKLSFGHLKQGQYGHFWNKPLIKNWLANYRSQRNDPDMLMAFWPNDLYHFNTTYGQWGGDDSNWQQACRKGYDLVVQLNFPKSHDRMYDKVIVDDDRPFVCDGHPIHYRRNTLGWSRIDIIGDWSEVLIEEILNDWLRKVQLVFEHLSWCSACL